LLSVFSQDKVKYTILFAFNLSISLTRGKAIYTRYHHPAILAKCDDIVTNKRIMVKMKSMARDSTQSCPLGTNN